MKVVIQERRFNEEGNAIGNAGTYEATVSEAKKLIEKGTHKAYGFAVGVIPEEWKAEKKSAKSKKVEAVEDGSDSN